MTSREFVSVYRSTKKTDTYIYVRRGQDWQELPEALRSIFGQPAHAMDLLLTPEKQLARTTGKEVLEALHEKGFFLQMPEEQDTYIVDFKRKVEQHKK
ncbi:MAG: YcgL domain-containing protein [Marinobacter sp.]|uniref:YcgL domain-containing protein n=1 Tax=unclassified Marinobacter TaxID=83889 RepID=UPI00273BCD35|nr:MULTISPECIES: YcgL domain-containing protein [unclassified Marinobacter]MDP4546374.1 YcgL domain-containing protein [Marinobacter sp. MDS2]